MKPRSLGTSRVISLVGKLIPWRGDGPATFSIDRESKDIYVPLFSTQAQLEMFAAVSVGWTYDSIKQVSDPKEFWESVPYSLDGALVHVAFDPRQLPNGKLRWSEVFRS